MTASSLLASVLFLIALAPPPVNWVDIVPLPDNLQPTEGTLINHDFDEGVFTIGTTDTKKRGK